MLEITNQIPFIMKKLFLLLSLFFVSTLSAQEIPEIDINTKVDEVTIFLKGAQVIRNKEISVKKGISILKFTNLSPYIDAKSIQFKADEHTTVHSLNFNKNFMEKLKKNQVLIDLENQYKKIDEQIEIENTHIEVIKDEITFLQENRKLSGKNENVSLETLKNTAAYYHDKLTELKIKILDKQKRIQELTDKNIDIEKQIKTYLTSKDFTKGEILIKIESEINQTLPVRLSYMVDNAGWLPAYDIRANSINQPIKIVYKANIKQDTKVDWKNVKIKLSSAQPNLTGVSPELKTYFLNYHLKPPVYNRQVSNFEGTVSGIVSDESGPLPGVSVLVKGTTIGTETDFDGHYTIMMPENESVLTFSFVGMDTQEIFVTNSIHDVLMKTNEDLVLEEVVVSALGRKRGERNIRSLGIAGATKDVIIKKKEKNSKPLPVEQIENQTSFDFKIDKAYSIMSNNKSLTINMITHSIPADYTYYSIPKIEKAAYLIAQITNWEKYNFLEGEANIFFENTFLGKTILDVRYASDTLDLSLGRDKNIVVNREKIKPLQSKKFLGNSKEEIVDWKINIKNNKAQKVKLVILDQIPVSTNDEIKIDVLESSYAKLNEENGEVKWTFNLNPGTNKDLHLKYKVKYPKHKNLYIE